MILKREVEKILKKALKKSFSLSLKKVPVEKPPREEFGDYSTNIALKISSQLTKPPLEIAKILKEIIEREYSDFFKKIEVFPPGFLNFFVAEKVLKKGLKEILKQKERFGVLNIGKNQKVNVEFVSANPTGPLTLGNARGGVCGDVLSNVLERVGYKVTREYYINDRGEQIKKLGKSVLGESQDYKGEYINYLKKRISQKVSHRVWEKVGREAADLIMKEMIKPSLKRMKIHFDVWFPESRLYSQGEVEKVLRYLEKKNLVYQKEGALYFKSKKFNDTQDRVLIKKNGQPTYFLSDIAYLNNKFKRGFQILVFFWGADHHGYVARMKGAVQALGRKPERVHFIVMQLVRLFRQGQEVRMSKREGVFVTVDELLDEVGVDVARFFFLTKHYNTHLEFDLDLAREKSEKNPVYYIQYAHARASNILKKAQFSPEKTLLKNLEFTHSKELELLKQILRFPEILETIAEDFEVQSLAQYTFSVAKIFHQFYTECKVLTQEENLRTTRLSLVLATKIVLKNCLDLMGISSPEKM